MRPTFRISAISILLIAFVQFSFAAIDARIDFETTLPTTFKCSDNSRIELSAAHYKDGEKSLRWSWDGPATLTFGDYVQLMKSFNAKNTGIMLWIYNTKAVATPLRFNFQTATGVVTYYFDFNMDFTGWRACWIKYNDMPGDHSSKQITRLVIDTPKGVDQGEIFIDRLTLSENPLHAQITPDQQIPDNNCNLTRELWHWARLWEWEQYQYETPLAEPTVAQKAMLAQVANRLTEVVRNSMSSDNYIKGTIVPNALKIFEAAKIRRTEQGGVIGAPLLSDDESNRSRGELRENDIEKMLYGFALARDVMDDPKQVDNFFLVFDHAIDQGFAFGSGTGTNHHYGYQIRKLYDAMWLMRDEIAKRGKTAEYVKVLAYWSGLAETRKPYVYGRDELLDTWHTLLKSKVISAMMLPTEAEQYRAMQGLGVWLSGSLGFSPGTIGGIKPDGTTFHHGGLYPAYSTGAFAAVGEYCNMTAGTDFVISEAARRTFKLALQTLRNYTNQKDWGLGLAGRHPFNGAIPVPDVNAFGYLAALGDLTGSGRNVDPELAGDFLRLNGTDKQMNALFRKEGISAANAPQGFFVYNYGAVGIHRRDNWMVTLKAFNTDVWGSEIYTKDNRFGRYQSYGSAPIIGTGNPISAKESGFSQEGWDWNRVPGATTIHLPFEELNSPQKGTLMERNPERFSGASSLEGQNGVLALHFVEGGRPTFTKGATAYKTIFCFDNRLVFLGSGIDNDNTTYPTETTLYQLRLDAPAEEVEIDGQVYTNFPLDFAKENVDRLMLSDTKGNFYVVKNAANVTVVKQQQESPNDQKIKTGSGNFVTAYLSHGTAPKQAAYEYAVYIQPSNKEIGKFARKDTYEVLRKDDTAHVVKDLATGITGYVCFNTYTADGLVQSVTQETIVMERTDASGVVTMSICTPDLGLTEKTYTTRQESQPIVKTVKLKGVWSAVTPNAAVAISNDNATTTLTVTCLNGQPVELKLKTNQAN